MPASAYALPLIYLGTPEGPVDDEFYSLIVGQYAFEYLIRFMERFKALLLEASPSLFAFISNQKLPNLSFDTSWHPSFAGVREGLLGAMEFSDTQLCHCAALVAVRLLECECDGEFEAKVDPSRRIMVGNYQLPRAERIQVLRSGKDFEVISVSKGKRRRIHFTKKRFKWRATNLTEVPNIKIFKSHCSLFPIELWPSISRQQPQFQVCELDNSEIERSTAKAILVLRNHSPRYFHWVDAVLRGIVPCRGEVAKLRSGSDFNMPGIVQVSYPAGPSAIAEMLVHECSHLNYQIATRLGEVDDGSDKTLYYSPVKETGRPIDRILLAYHAFGNVLLFYRDCLKSGIRDDGYCERNERRTLVQLRQLESALESTSALTSIGRSLYGTVSAAISRT